MTDKQIRKLTLHISSDLDDEIEKAMVKLKLSKGTIIRKALDEYLANLKQGKN